MRITNYVEALDMINVRFTDKMKDFFKGLEREGYTERSICYAIWKSSDKIMQFKDDSRFLSVMANEIRKNTWRKNDPRWKEYNARKER